jgi:hypothetical protein
VIGLETELRSETKTPAINRDEKPKLRLVHFGASRRPHPIRREAELPRASYSRLLCLIPDRDPPLQSFAVAPLERVYGFDRNF